MEALIILVLVLTVVVIVLVFATWSAHERIGFVHERISSTREWVGELQRDLEPVGEDEDRILDRLATVIKERKAAAELGKKLIAAVESADA